jgi:outer membrane lipoprotein-sorting protein
VKASSCCARITATTLAPLLSGCFLLSTTRKLPVPKGPPAIQTVSPQELVNRLDQRWSTLNSLTAKVEIQASVLHSTEGIAKDYTTVPGVIVMRKPQMLRVYGMVPVVRTELFDMVSDGSKFTLYIPAKSKAIEGSNTVSARSANQLENLRPGFFLDALAVRGPAAGDRYTVTADVDVVEDAAKKHLYSVPEYILSIHRPEPGSQEDTPLRVVWFHRDDLLPYQQDVYDRAGNVETQIYYSTYGDYAGNKYPSKVTIKRPIDQIQIVLTIESVVENQKLPPDEFAIKIPPDTQVQQLGAASSGSTQ